VSGPVVERGALFVEIVVKIVGALDPVAGVIEHALCNVGRNA